MPWLAYVLLILLFACLGMFCYLSIKFWKEEGRQDVDFSSENPAEFLQQAKGQGKS